MKVIAADATTKLQEANFPAFPTGGAAITYL
jgi:hypothetical protein